MISGRLFYKCAKPQGSKCDFFLWASDDIASRSNATSNDSMWTFSVNRNNVRTDSFPHADTSNIDWSNATTSNVMCHCNQPARK